MMYDFSVIVCGCTKNSASYIEENITMPTSNVTYSKKSLE